MTDNNIENIDENDSVINDDELTPHINVIKMPVGDLMRKNYLNYAVSVIMDRALPDVRDGLKPVHRRILYSMYELRMFPGTSHQKSARLVGEVMGKYHPHGDTSIYDAAVHMAQPWSKRIPLIDGQGNFGSVDGDSAAAMRYCFKAGTRVMTSRGLVKIESLVSETELEAALSHSDVHSYVPLDMQLESSNGVKTASKWIYSGKQDTISLLTTNGYETTCTPNEPFLVLNEKFDYVWVDVQDLKVGDKICMLGKAAEVKVKSQQSLEKYHPQSNDKTHQLPLIMSTQLAHVLGAIVSNGSINSKTNEIVFISNDEKLFNAFISAFKSVFNDVLNYNIDDISNLENNINTKRFSITSSYLSQFLMNMGCKNEDSILIVPEIIFNSSKEEVASFVKCYFDSAKVYAVNNQITITTSSPNKELLSDIKLLLLNYFGIVSDKIINEENMYICEITQSSQVEKFKEQINFNCEEKSIQIEKNKYIKMSLDSQEKVSGNITISAIKDSASKVTFKSIADKLEDINARNYFYATIESLTKQENQAVFDLTVPETHAFVANGFIVHNTEARLTKAGAAFFEDIDKDTVQFRDNYDGREREPEILPVSYPNIWINGVEGIAVGMATYLPPHNLNETVDVTIALQRNPELSIEEILQIMPAPDFPTGGIVHDLDGFRNAILTGKGMVRVRSKWHTENVKTGQELLVIDELPYKVNKKILIEDIVSKVKAKDADLEDIIDINDESTERDGMRIAIVLKKGSIPAVIFNHLVKKTKIEESYNYNVMLLEGQNPKQMGLIEILKRFLVFREEIIVKRINFELRKGTEKLHLLTGMMIVLGNLNHAIKIIMDNSDKDSASKALRENFSIDEIQAKSILEMRLHRLTGMEIDTIKEDFTQLSAEVTDMLDSLKNPVRIQEMIKKDLISAKERFGDDRRSEVSYENNQINMNDLIKKEPCLIHVTKNGYLKRMPLSILGTQNRNGKGRMGIQTGNDDYVESIYTGSTHDLFMVFTKSGKAMSSRVWNLPDGTTAQRGRHLRNIFESLNEPIANLLLVPEIEEGLSVITVTAKGKVKRTALSEYTGTLRRKGVQGVSIEEGDSLVSVLLAKRHDHLILVTSAGKAARFEIDDEVLQIRGRKSVGVKGIVVGKNATVVGAMVINSNGEAMPEITVKKTKTLFGEDVVEDVIQLDTSVMDNGKYLFCMGENGVGKRTEVSEFTPHSRGTKGVNCFNINEKTGALVKVALVTDEDDLMMTTANKTLRIRVSDVRLAGRNTAGTMLMNVGVEKLIDVIKVPREEVSEEPLELSDEIDSDDVGSEILGNNSNSTEEE